MTISGRACACLAMMMASGCTARVGGVEGITPSVGVAVQPTVTWLTPGASSRFSARVTGADSSAVRWVVDETDGGTVDASGVYVAPQRTGTFHVRAISTTGTSGAAQVNVTPAQTAQCATAPLRTTSPATVYYYCDCKDGHEDGCVPGDDRASGTSPSAPRQSLADARLRFNGMNAGDTVALCRGGAWAESYASIYNTRCRAASPCDWRDYTPTWGSGTARPILNVGTSTMFYISTDGHDEGYRFWNLDIRHTGLSGGTFALGRDVTDVDICNVAGSGGNIGVQDEPSDARITIRNSQFTGYGLDAVLAGSHNLTLDSNYFDRNGEGFNQRHTIYLQGGDVPTDGWHDERIVNNEIHVGSGCQGPVVVVHGRHVNTVLENNLIVGTGVVGGCFGVEMSHGGYPFSTWSRNAVVRRNRVLMSGAYIGIGVTSCAGCTFTDNVVVLDTAYDALMGIAVPEAAARTSPADDVTSDAIIQNNTVYLPRSTGVVTSYGGIRVGIEGSGYVVEDNAVWTAGASGTCVPVSRPYLRDGFNYCRGSGGTPVGSVFVDAPGGDFRPVATGPLVGTADPNNYSATAIGSAEWSSSDTGIARTPPVDIGAMVH